ncbi:hypothetical protein A2310_00305 [candidate division WOR-1 bacterium RIFOXYB2_FULL_37_13]|uniref:Uncharacterized protein n=1 Tax=candidate division WOR-1 bacterium RIFOXYB2_FULL_37_13 TaxID=1802579 RepID=A0A1F4SPW1_UNCSA|nr:MAG: hypothetical protein A2310_00305 [candidate division WOR-1 bacterium RIFOXYB2_FULL_37_13]
MTQTSSKSCLLLAMSRHAFYEINRHIPTTQKGLPKILKRKLYGDVIPRIERTLSTADTIKAKEIISIVIETVMDFWKKDPSLETAKKLSEELDNVMLIIETAHFFNQVIGENIVNFSSLSPCLKMFSNLPIIRRLSRMVEDIKATAQKSPPDFAITPALWTGFKSSEYDN